MASLEVQFANGLIPITVAVRRFKSFLTLVSATSLQRKVRPNYTRIRYRRNEIIGRQRVVFTALTPDFTAFSVLFY